MTACLVFILKDLYKRFCICTDYFRKDGKLAVTRVGSGSKTNVGGVGDSPFHFTPVSV